MSEELKTPVSTTIKYKDGSETVVHYNEIGEKMSEETTLPEGEVPTEVVEEKVKVSAEEVKSTEQVGQE